MSRDFEEYALSFHARARKTFFSLFAEFKIAVTAIDRQGKENVFQRVQLKYLRELKNRLEGIALEILASCKYIHERDDMNRQLSGYIDAYSNEFLQKMRAL